MNVTSEYVGGGRKGSPPPEHKEAVRLLLESIKSSQITELEASSSTHSSDESSSSSSSDIADQKPQLTSKQQNCELIKKNKTFEDTENNHSRSPLMKTKISKQINTKTDQLPMRSNSIKKTNKQIQVIPSRTIAVQCDLKLSSPSSPSSATTSSPAKINKNSNELNEPIKHETANKDTKGMRASSISSTRYGFYESNNAKDTSSSLSSSESDDNDKYMSSGPGKTIVVERGLQDKAYKLEDDLPTIRRHREISVTYTGSQFSASSLEKSESSSSTDTINKYQTLLLRNESEKFRRRDQSSSKSFAGSRTSSTATATGKNIEYNKDNEELGRHKIKRTISCSQARKTVPLEVANKRHYANYLENNRLGKESQHFRSSFQSANSDTIMPRRCDESLKRTNKQTNLSTNTNTKQKPQIIELTFDRQQPSNKSRPLEYTTLDTRLRGPRLVQRTKLYDSDVSNQRINNTSNSLRHNKCLATSKLSLNDNVISKLNSKANNDDTNKYNSLCFPIKRPVLVTDNIKKLQQQKQKPQDLSEPTSLLVTNDSRQSTRRHQRDLYISRDKNNNSSKLIRSNSLSRQQEQGQTQKQLSSSTSQSSVDVSSNKNNDHIKTKLSNTRISSKSDTKADKIARSNSYIVPKTQRKFGYEQTKEDEEDVDIYGNDDEKVREKNYQRLKMMSNRGERLVKSMKLAQGSSFINIGPSPRQQRLQATKSMRESTSPLKYPTTNKSELSLEEMKKNLKVQGHYDKRQVVEQKALTSNKQKQPIQPSSSSSSSSQDDDEYYAKGDQCLECNKLTKSHLLPHLNSQNNKHQGYTGYNYQDFDTAKNRSTSSSLSSLSSSSSPKVQLMSQLRQNKQPNRHQKVSNQRQFEATLELSNDSSGGSSYLTSNDESIHQQNSQETFARLNESGLPVVNPENTAYNYVNKSQNRKLYAGYKANDSRSLSSSHCYSYTDNNGGHNDDDNLDFLYPEQRRSRSSGVTGRALSSQSLARQSMPKEAVRGRRYKTNYNINGVSSTCSSSDYIGGSSMSLVNGNFATMSPLTVDTNLGSSKVKTFYEEARIRTPLVMNIPQSSRSRQCSIVDESDNDNNIDDDGDGCNYSGDKRDRSLSRSVASSSSRKKSLKQRLLLSRSSSMRRQRSMNSSKHRVPIENSSMFCTLVKPRNNQGQGDRGQKGTSVSSRSNRNSAGSCGDSDELGDTPTPRLASELDAKKFKRRTRQSAPRGAKPNWLERLRQRISSAAK